ncbi:MAG: hypothetical protein VX000_00600, partial [Myxococcota bacterium]|nr:hypothetical protein [Myxococcota bacterium]
MSDAHTDRLQAIQAELASILEDRLAALDAALRGSEGTTRRIIGAEVELERHRATSVRLASEVSALEEELSVARDRAASLRNQHGELIAERDELRNNMASLEREVGD